jgi:hypothetical protein
VKMSRPRESCDSLEILGKLEFELAGPRENRKIFVGGLKDD